MNGEQYKEFHKQFSSSGGKKTKEKYGEDYYRELQKKSTKAKLEKKRLLKPVEITANEV